MFTIFALSMIVGVSLAAKRRRGTLVVLSVLVVGLLAFFDPFSFGFAGQQRPPAFRWATFGAWTGIFLMTASLVVTFYERRFVSPPKSRPQVPSPVSLPYDLLLATMTHLSRVEKFVKRFPPLQRGGWQRSGPGNQGHAGPTPLSANQAD